MSPSSLLPLVEQALQRHLTGLEQLILQGSWQGQRYRQMADGSGYGEEYLKQVGARLWAELSGKMCTPVTKKNLRLIFGRSGAGSGPLDNVVPLFRAESLPVASQSMTPLPPQAAPDPRLLGGTFAYPSGPLPLDSALYINRPRVEETAFAEINRPGCLLCIKAPKRFGKTSLLYRVMAQAAAQGDRLCQIDLQEADDRVFDSIDELLRWFCHRMAYALELDLKVDQLWDPDLGSKVNCGLWLQQALAQADSPLLLTINALEQVFPHEAVARDFLSMLRCWHERSKYEALWQRLRLVLVYGTDSYVALSIEALPFNVGHSLRLPPFTLDQFLELGRRYQLPQIDQASQRFSLEALYRLIAGHPYLASLSFYALTQKQQSLPEVLNTSTTVDGIFRAHLQEIGAQLRQNPAVLAASHRGAGGVPRWG